jgi:hypothetical protein
MTALGAWLRERDLLTGRWLDPAAGAGTALHWMGVPFEDRWAMEYRDDPPAVRALAQFVPPAQTMTGVNALNAAWDPAANVFTNPPFALLDEFFVHAVDSGRLGGFPVTVFMMPTQWWQAQKRADYPRPDHIVAPCWRLPFIGKGGAQHDTCFAVWEPTASGGETRIHWVGRPRLPRKGPHRAHVWDEFESIQPAEHELNMYLDV